MPSQGLIVVVGAKGGKGKAKGQTAAGYQQLVVDSEGVGYGWSVL